MNGELVQPGASWHAHAGHCQNRTFRLAEANV